MSHVAYIINTLNSHVDGLCYTYDARVIESSHTHDTREDGSCHTYNTHVHESRHTCNTHVYVSCHTYESVSTMRMQHITFVKGHTTHVYCDTFIHTCTTYTQLPLAFQMRTIHIYIQSISIHTITYS